MMTRRKSGQSFRVVISAEANSYMAWQCKLAHYSCLSRFGQAPVFIVHDAEEKDIPDWKEITATGGAIFKAPSYRQTSRGMDYACRNAAGTLLEAARVIGSETTSLLLCDP